MSGTPSRSERPRAWRFIAEDIGALARDLLRQGPGDKRRAAVEARMQSEAGQQRLEAMLHPVVFRHLANDEEIDEHQATVLIATVAAAIVLGDAGAAIEGGLQAILSLPPDDFLQLQSLHEEFAGDALWRRRHVRLFVEEPARAAALARLSELGLVACGRLTATGQCLVRALVRASSSP